MAPRKAKDCSNMEEVRAEIDRIDQALVDLIGERFAFVDRAWQLKQSPAEARVPWRIQQVIDKVRARAAEKGLPPELAEALWRQMIGWFIQYEEEKLQQSEKDGGTPPNPGSSCPALCRASTNCLQQHPAYSYSDVGGRDKPGHDRIRWYGSKSRKIESHRRARPDPGRW